MFRIAFFQAFSPAIFPMRFSLGVAAAALTTLLAVLAAPPAGAQTLRWAAQNDVLTLDPHSQNHVTTSAILGHAYEALVRYSPTYQVEPSLATKWTVLSPTQIRFELRKGVAFHDGTLFTADDVLFSFERIRQPQGTMQIFVAGVDQIRKVDNHTVDLILSGPNPTLLRNLTDFRIMSKAWSEKNKTTRVQDYKAKEENFASRNVMGTGPYRILSWQPEQRIMMARHEGWWDKSPRAIGNVDQVVYTPIKAEATRVAALLAGDVDLLTDVPVQDLERLGRDKRLKVLNGPEVRTIFLAPDMGSPELKHASVKGKNPFADKKVRQALSLAVDREAIKRSIMRGMSIPAALIVAPGVNGWTQALDTPAKVDVARAKALLKEAGYPDGFELRLNCPNNRYVNDEKICQAVVAMWARVGVKAQLASENMATFIQKVQNFDSSVYLLGWGVANYDAQYSLQSLVRTRTSGADGNFNFSKVSDAQLDRLIDGMKSEVDVTKRNAMIRDALVRVRDETLLIPLHHQIRPWVMKAGVSTVHRSDDKPEARFTSMR